MDPGQMQFLSLLTGALYVGGTGCLHLYKKHKNTKKKRLFVVLVPRKIGLTTQLEKIEPNDKMVIVDSDTSILNSVEKPRRAFLEEMREKDKMYFNTHYYPLVSKYLEDIKNIHKNKVVMMFTSDPELVDYLKIEDRCCSILFPSLTMVNQLVKVYDDEEVNLLTQSRDTLITLPYAKFLFSSFSDLSTKLEKLLNPKS